MTYRFNLVTDPWIAVKAENSVVEYSLLKVFERAPTVRGLAGELPSQDAAILRLLLAIMARAVAAERDSDTAEDLWGKWWRGGELPLDEIANYLARHADRFDLFDEVQPFMQTAGLESPSGRTSGIVKLVAEIPDGVKFFTLRNGAGLESVSVAEATRWLVHCQAFDTSGIKTGVVGDPRIRGGKTYPLGTAYTGNLGLVMAEGTTLLETLLLNFCLKRAVPEDSTPWERPPQVVGPSSLHPQPVGMADLFTWQSRRIRLLPSHQDDVVVINDAVVTYGDAIRPENLRDFETMSAFKRSPNLSKKSGRPVYWPVRHQPERAVWRGLDSLIGGRTNEKDADGPYGIEWLDGLRSRGNLPADTVIQLRTVGVEYGPQSSTIARVIEDSMAASVGALTSPTVLAMAITSAKTAADLAWACTLLARNLTEAAGGDPKAEHSDANLEAYSALDPLFREWFASLSVETDPASAEAAWQQQARDRALSVGDDAVTRAGSSAVRGRSRKALPPNISRFGILNAASAHRAFVTHVRRLTPLANPVPADRQVNS